MVRFLILSILMVATISCEPEGKALRHRRLLDIREKILQKDKMRSCLDVNGEKVVLDDKLSACNYITYKDGSFGQVCQNTFANGDPVGAVCPSKSDDPLVRDNTSADVIAYWNSIFVNISLVPDNYQLTLSALGGSGRCKCRETFRTKPLPGNCGFPEYDEPGASSGRKGCSDETCNDAVCDVEFGHPFCCGLKSDGVTEGSGFWDRICVGYADHFCD